MIKRLITTKDDVIEELYRALSRLPRWKRKIVKWLWSDIIKVADTLREYYWSDKNDE